jgi:hypothetical protein
MLLILTLTIVGILLVLFWTLHAIDRRLSDVERQVGYNGRAAAAGWRPPVAALLRRGGLKSSALIDVIKRPVVAWVLGLNVLLALLWLWSMPGYTSRITLRAVGNHYHAVVDGRDIADADLPGPAAGGVALRMTGSGSLPSGAGAPRVRSIVVTDLRTGVRLMQEHFDGQGDQLAGGDPWPGGFVPKDGGLLSTGAKPWTDYRVDVVLENPITATLFVRYSDEGTNTQFWFRPWRDLDTGLSVEQNATQIVAQSGARLQLDPTQSARAVLAVVLRRYPWFLLGSVLIAAVFFVLTRVDRRIPGRHRGLGSGGGWLYVPGAIGLFFAAVCGLAYSQTVYVERIPHVIDSAIYLFQAKMFAAGMIAAPAPAVPAAFQDYWGYLVPHRGLWVSQYPFGHPLLLAIGQRLGQAWLVPPVVGGACVLLVFWIGRTLHAPTTGLLASLLLVASPFFQMSNVDYMSHGSGAFYLLGAILGLIYLFQGRSARMRAAGGAASGGCLGLLFNTRPLTGFVAVVIVGAFLGLHVARERWRWRPELLAFLAAGGAFLLTYFAYNTYLMGSPLDNPYTLSNTASSDNLGFAGHLSPQLAFSNLYTSVTMLDVVLFGSPPGVAFLAVLLPFLLGTRNRWDYLFGALALGIAVAWFFYIDPFITYGPRLWYEMTPLLALLAARGVSLAVIRAQHLARKRSPGSLGDLIIVPVAAAVVGAGVVLSLLSWWAPPSPDRPGYTGVPQNVRDLRGFNGVDGRLVDAAMALDPYHAIVLVKDNCPPCFVPALAQNDPLLQGTIIFARDRGPATNEQLTEFYPGRSLYRATDTRPVQLAPALSSR